LTKAKIDQSFRTAQSKIVRRSELARIISDAKAQGKTVVFTNGCFDLLHVGHVRYLEQARSMGDMLVVGVNSDESVTRLKGQGRPLVSEFERLEVLAALECVDWVTLFAEDTPVELIEAIRPDTHVKGGDYKIEDLPEAEVMKRLGARVVIIPYSSTRTEGCSSSDLLDRMTKAANQEARECTSDG